MSWRSILKTKQNAVIVYIRKSSVGEAKMEDTIWGMLESRYKKVESDDPSPHDEMLHANFDNKITFLSDSKNESSILP